MIDSKQYRQSTLIKKEKYSKTKNVVACRRVCMKRALTALTGKRDPIPASCMFDNET